MGIVSCFFLPCRGYAFGVALGALQQGLVKFDDCCCVAVVYDERESAASSADVLRVVVPVRHFPRLLPVKRLENK